MQKLAVLSWYECDDIFFCSSCHAAKVSEVVCLWDVLIPSGKRAAISELDSHFSGLSPYVLLLQMHSGVLPSPPACVEAYGWGVTDRPQSPDILAFILWPTVYQFFPFGKHNPGSLRKALGKEGILVSLRFLLETVQSVESIVDQLTLKTTVEESNHFPCYSVYVMLQDLPHHIQVHRIKDL